MRIFKHLKLHKGGPGSGNFGHAGRRSEHLRGGSTRRGPMSVEIPVPEDAVDIIKQLQDAGYPAFVVGGAVRDHFAGKAMHDVDIASAAPLEVLDRVLKNKTVVTTGESHGTRLVLGRRDGKVYELTTLREDVNSDGRHSEVRFVNDITQDLQRRDLTFNALAFDPISKQLYGPGPNGDPSEALDDLQAKRVRFVGDGYQRIVEDRLRALRAVRFKYKLGGEIASDSADAIKRAVRDGLIPGGKLSGERIRDELVKLFAIPGGVRGMQDWVDLGLMEAIVPEAQRMVGMKQNRWHYPCDVFQHTLNSMNGEKEAYSPDFEAWTKPPAELSEAEAGRSVMRLALLLHDIGKPPTAAFKSEDYGNSFINHEEVGGPIAQKVCDRLRIPNDISDYIVRAVVGHTDVPDWDKKSSPKYIRRWLRENGKYVPFLLAVAYNDRASIPGIGSEKARIGYENVIRVMNEAPPPKPLINGGDVLKLLGYTSPPKTGDPRIGQVLRAVSEWVDEDPSRNTRESLLDFARSEITRIRKGLA